MNWKDNYWQERYGCTRNQYRRIIQGAPYNEALDGPWGEYKARMEAIE